MLVFFLTFILKQNKMLRRLFPVEIKVHAGEISKKQRKLKKKWINFFIYHKRKLLLQPEQRERHKKKQNQHPANGTSFYCLFERL